MAAKKRKANQTKMDEMESEIGDIKNLLVQILEKMSKEDSK